MAEPLKGSDMMSVREAASALGVTPARVHQMIKQGRIFPAESFRSESGSVIFWSFTESEVARVKALRDRIESAKRELEGAA